MVKALQAFLNFCYIVRHDVHNTQSLEALQDALDCFHKHREIFETSSIHLNGFNLPQSHAAVHYMHLIWAFGAPNGLCSSITESKHIVAVKEPWQRSSRWQALRQMLTTNSHLDKLAAAWVDFASHGMLEGTVVVGVLSQLGKSDSNLYCILNSHNFGLSRYPIIWWWSTPTGPTSTSCHSDTWWWWGGQSQ